MASAGASGALEETDQGDGARNRCTRNSSTSPHGFRSRRSAHGLEDRRMLYPVGNSSGTPTAPSSRCRHGVAALGREVPPAGGETEFVSMRYAHATLRGIASAARGRVVVHQHPLLEEHHREGALRPRHERSSRRCASPRAPSIPRTVGRRSTWVAAWYVEGMPYDESPAARRSPGPYDAPRVHLSGPLAAVGSRDVGTTAACCIAAGRGMPRPPARDARTDCGR